MKTACVILAGGAGKRMKSERPKVLAEVLCKPMLGWVLDAAKDSDSMRQPLSPDSALSLPAGTFPPAARRSRSATRLSRKAPGTP